MKFYINYSIQNTDFVQHLAEDLRARGHQINIDTLEIRLGDNIIEKIEIGLKEAEFIIIVLSSATMNSQWMQQELSIFRAREINHDQQNIIPVLVDECELPDHLLSRPPIDFSHSYEWGLEKLLEEVKRLNHKNRKNLTPLSRVERDQETKRVQIKRLREALQEEGNLSLFCGAGISIGANIPPWGSLLRSLIGDLFSMGLLNGNPSPDLQKDELAGFYQNYFSPTSLMIAQYLKNGLGKDFLSSVRRALYRSDPTTCALIDSIVELCRPQRAKHALHSIVTYNFDDLVEKNLESHSVRYRSIYKEGQRHSSQELPIYHVHGFLPAQGELTEEHQLVFSEDAYHAQFTDPFSWANLIQLNHLNSNTCLFVGLSMTDPNLRRLLDVSMRKNPDRKLSHYLFRKRHNRNEIAIEMQKRGIVDEDGNQCRAFARGQELLEEQDSNNLGLNVIWVDEFEEIPEFLTRLIRE